VLLIGKLTAGLKDESTTVTEFVARVIVEMNAAAGGGGGGAPRMKLYQVWTGASVTSKCSLIVSDADIPLLAVSGFLTV